MYEKHKRSDAPVALAVVESSQEVIYNSDSAFNPPPRKRYQQYRHDVMDHNLDKTVCHKDPVRPEALNTSVKSLRFVSDDKEYSSDMYLPT